MCKLGLQMFLLSEAIWHRWSCTAWGWNEILKSTQQHRPIPTQHHPFHTYNSSGGKCNLITEVFNFVPVRTPSYHGWHAKNCVKVMHASGGKTSLLFSLQLQIKRNATFQLFLYYIYHTFYIQYSHLTFACI